MQGGFSETSLQTTRRHILELIYPDNGRRRIRRNSSTLLLDYAILTSQEKAFLINPLKPTDHVMQHQFNVQQLYSLPTLYLCVLHLSENKQRPVPLTAKTDWFL